MNTIRPIFGSAPQLMNQLNKSTPAPSQGEGINFMDRLKSAMSDVNNRQVVADTASEQVVQGKMGIHEGMMAVQEADVSLRYMLQVRGKTVEAYREIMRMQF
ncbi:flagellar hook-basal body complex protein FliE [Desulforegula conservatrix]|uniref:flagellar hook-basal body complex protein FliE n=1 Tax=Desulforegula conservatrix TaxID=153026 RepID=UPI0003F8DF57|nr:flagellar hook-basal body complex protein FliE [Desulforegula conservatrix]